MIELWGGVECTVNRVHDRWFDQVARSGHHERADDLDRFAELGIRAIRYPVLWERVAPDSADAADWRWTDERLARLKDLDIRPIAGLLHHGSGPAYTSLVDPDFPAKLSRFARQAARRYPWVTDFTPVNEPLTTARFSGLYGHWYPHGRDDATFVRALMQQVHGTAAAMRAIREVTPGARLIQTEDCGRTSGSEATSRQVQFERERQWLTWDLLAGRVNQAHPLWRWLVKAGAAAAELAALVDAPCPPDVVGLNYYLTSDRMLDARVERYPPSCHGGNGRQLYADVEAVRASPEGIVGHEAHLQSAWERYGLPVALTEVHLGCTREEQVRWLLEAWRGAKAAEARGVDVRGVTAWALLGSYDWDSLVTRVTDHYEPGAFDVRATLPRATALAEAMRAIGADREPSSAAIAGTPWWRRSVRLANTAVAPLAPVAPLASSGPPLLIIGASGTLGRAFHRVAAARGLRSRLIGRAEADIADPSAVDAIIRHVAPWAVINAAGYVRVDDAESDREACWRSNVTGPVTLAAACRRRGLPLVTFSSDLVFDGDAGRAYTEDDTPNPRNVYGASKAEAEHRVLDVMDRALVVRTSAFFGPWDRHNFLAALGRALEAGERFLAPHDTVVSPTYVPHLVNTTLDLLIDGERGIWNLANAGAVSWFEFAVAAAELGGWEADRIEGVPTREIWGPAARPASTVLTSARGAIMPSLEDGLAAYLQEARQLIESRTMDTCVSP